MAANFIFFSVLACGMYVSSMSTICQSDASCNDPGSFKRPAIPNSYCLESPVAAAAPRPVSIALLKRDYGDLRLARAPHARALAAYRLNCAADVYANQLNRRDDVYVENKFKVNTEPQVQIADRYGAAIGWCDYDGGWTARPNGYFAYVSLWPDGPLAEEAWWRGRLHWQANRCFDAVGSEEETLSFVQDYQEFLGHFPHGVHEREARELLKEFQADLEGYKQQKTP